MDIQKSGVSNPPDAGLYHWMHRGLLKFRQQWLFRLLLSITFTLENFYANKLRPRLGFRYSEKYLAYSWILGSFLLPPGKHILDIGCGDSLFPSKLASLGYKSYAIDLLDSGCIAASDLRVNFVQSDVCHMPFQPGEVEVITAISTLEHVDLDKMGLAVSEIGRVLHEDGVIFITMPDCDEAESMCQLLIHNFKVLSHEHRILTNKKVITEPSSSTIPDVPQGGVGVTFLTLTKVKRVGEA